MTDPNRTQMLPTDPNRTVMTLAPTANVTQTLQPVQCPVCKTFNGPGMVYCIECGLIFSMSDALPDDAFGAPAVRLPCLVDESGREQHLRPGDNLVGREGDILLMDAKVSRKHAVIRMEGSSVFVKDLGSTNGTTVRGEKLAPDAEIELMAGDRVEFGGVGLTLSLPGESAATQIPVSSKTQSIAAPPTVDASRATLEVDGEPFPLKPGSNTLGRKDSNDIVISDPYVSGSHATIEVTESEILLTDVGSTNGTMLNGARMVPNEPVRINPDDEIMIGAKTLRIRLKE